MKYKIEKQTVIDVESTFNYLLGVISSVKGGDRQEYEEGAFPYARSVVQGAEAPLNKLGLYKKACYTIDESERLILVGQFEEADELILCTAREMMEKSGSNDRLRKLYEGPNAPFAHLKKQQ